MQSQVYNAGSLVAGDSCSKSDRVIILVSGRIKVPKTKERECGFPPWGCLNLIHVGIKVT